MRTRIELAWQKEREEQHRLLQETSTLARDLRQTLFEVERERDKERLEAKRKQDQLKKMMDEELEENRRKITEVNNCALIKEIIDVTFFISSSDAIRSAGVKRCPCKIAHNKRKIPAGEGEARKGQGRAETYAECEKAARCR